MTALKLEDRLAVLAAMSPAQLRAEWQKVCKSAPPEAGPTLLRLGIAHRLQARRHMDLDPASQREIAKLGETLDRDGALTTEPMATIKPGTRLVREWHGTTHQVLILETSYIYRDRSYCSLTQVAKEITGAHWSGPRFFGLVRGRKRRGPTGPTASEAETHG